MMRKISVFIIALMMLAALLPETAFAEDYGITVCGVTVTSDNKDDVLGDRTVSYDAEKKTLTLAGAQLSDDISARNTDLTIKGSGTVSSSDSSAIYVREGDLTLDGDFTLSSGGQSALFVASGNNLTVNGGTIEAECTGYQIAISVGGALTVNGGTLHSKSTTGKKALSVRMINLNTDNGIQFLQGDINSSEVLIGAYVEYPIYVCYVQVTSANAGNVLAGDEANDGRVKYDAEKKTLTLDGAELSNTGKCISANGTDLTIEGSGTISSSSGNAIIVEGDLTLDGDFTLSSGGQSTVLVTIGNNLTVNGGTIEAECTGGQTTIYVGGDLTVKDGTLHSKSTTGHYAINAREITLNEENGIRFLLGYENASEVLIGAYVEYPISVCGVDVTSANARNVLKGDEANDGRVKYDAATNTLTLDGAKLEYDGDCIYVEYNTDLTIKGSAEIHNLSSIAIYLDQGNLTLDGDFTVTTDSGPTAIYVLAMTVNGGTLYAKSNAADGCALYTPMGLTLNEEKGIQFLQGDIGSSEILIGAYVEYPVKVCGVKVTSANAGNVLAGGDNDNKVKYDAATKTLTLDNAKLSSTMNSCILTDNADLTIKGSGTISSSSGNAIIVEGDLTLDGDFTLFSSVQNAVYVGGGLTVNGGKIEAESAGNQNTISVGRDLTVNGGTLHSKSTTGERALSVRSINLNTDNGIQFLQGDIGSSEVLIGAKAPTTLKKDEQGRYMIGTAADLDDFAALVNGGEQRAKAILTADITYTGKNWTPIGTDSTYSGTFDGGGHTITGLSNEEAETAPEYAGLFGRNGGTVKNVIIENGYIKGSKYAGGIAGFNSVTIENCISSGTVTAAGEVVYAGGIAGRNDSAIENCVNTAAVNATGSNSAHSGGIAGKTNGNGSIKNCLNHGDVTASGDLNIEAGGIAGFNNGTIDSCVNTGAAEGKRAGGIAGKNDNAVKNCLNIGAVTSKENGCAGGVIGNLDLSSANIEACLNIGEVSGGTNNGGIVGDAGDNSSIDYCFSIDTADGNLIGKNRGATATNLTQLSLEEFADRSRFTSLVLNNVWVMGDEYPIIKALSQKVTFYANDGTDTAAEQYVIKTYETALRENTFKYDGHTFTGWNDKTDGTGAVSFDDKAKVALSEDITLYGQWNQTATAPTVTKQPQDLALEIGYAPATLELIVEQPEDSELQYQWYSCKDKERTEPERISDANGAALTIPDGKPAGTKEYYYCVVSVKDFDELQVVSDVAEVTVTKIKVTIKAKDAQKVYGDEEPRSFEYTIEGNITPSDYDKLGKIELNRSNGDDVGAYAINVTTPNTVSNEYYDVKTVPGVFTITPRSITIKAVDKEKAYGDPDPELTVKAEGLVGDDKLYDCTLSRAVGEKLGEYEISAEVIKSSNPNYIITVKNGTFTIKRRPVTVKAEDKEKTYRSSDPELTATTEGVLEGDSLNYTLAREEGENAGEYAITVTLGENPNYEVTAEDGVFTITRKRSGAGGGVSLAGNKKDIETGESKNGTVTLSSDSANEGETVTVTVTPDSGYILKEISAEDSKGNKIELTADGDGTLSFKMPADSVNITAEFGKEENGDKAAGFKDVKADSWYKEYIDAAVKKGIMKGTSADTFEPDEPMTRAMIVTILYRVEGEPDIAYASSFEDVEKDSWYAAAVSWAKENGIVMGMTDALFAPDELITREQLAAILYRYASFKGYDTSKKADLSVYEDGRDISDWAKDAMSWANAEGLIGGKTAKTLAPKDNATRAEAAVIFVKVTDLM